MDYWITGDSLEIIVKGGQAICHHTISILYGGDGLSLRKVHPVELEDHYSYK